MTLVKLGSWEGGEGGWGLGRGEMGKFQSNLTQLVCMHGIDLEWQAGGVTFAVTHVC